MDYFVFDVEIFKNFFCVTFWSPKGIKIFEFSERTKMNLRDFTRTLENLKGRYGVGFNSVNYDDLILNKAYEMCKTSDWEYDTFCQELKDFSDLIIYGQNVQTIKWVKYQPKKVQLELPFDIEEIKEEVNKSKFNLTEEEWYEAIRPYKYLHTWIDTDLYLFWSKGLRMTKQLSLKSIACQLNYPVIQELPIPHDALVKLSDIPNIIEYNSVHDIGVTKLLFDYLQEEVALRLDVSKQGFKAMSWDAPKIASEILLKAYCEKAFGVSDWETLKTIRNTRQEKEEFKIGDYLPKIEFKTPLFKNMYEKCRESYNSFSYSVVVPTEPPLKLDYGVGGIHNSFENKVFKSTSLIQLLTSDVDSLYPTFIENMKVFRFPEVQEEYSAKKEYRLSVTKPNLKKAKKSGDKTEITIWSVKDSFNKLILNGVSGLLDSSFSWLYNNIPINILRIYGQMLLSRLVEECWINGIIVVSANTDGIECLVPLDKKELYLEIVKTIEKEFNVTFSHEDYTTIYYKNVNNYLAITPNGTKEKGSTFLTKPPVGNSNDFLAIPKALKEHLVNKTPIEEMFCDKNWSKYFTIFDFCASFKISKKYTVIHNGAVQQQLNRFYVSRKGAYLYKLKKGKQNQENVLKGWGVDLLNRYDSSVTDYPIDFRFYISKTKKILEELETRQLNLLNEFFG